MSLKVLSGITFTKLIGMCVLALTRSKILEVRGFLPPQTLLLTCPPDILLPNVVHAHHLRCSPRSSPPPRRPQLSRRPRLPSARGRRGMDVSCDSERLRIHVSYLARLAFTTRYSRRACRQAFPR